MYPPKIFQILRIFSLTCTKVFVYSCRYRIKKEILKEIYDGETQKFPADG